MIQLFRERPELFNALVAMYANLALSTAVWYFDMLVAFLVAFALAYGGCSLVRRVFPGERGARPRVWRVPLIFACVAVGFPLFLDAFVSNVLRNGLEYFSLIPGESLLRIAACVWVAGGAITLFRTVRGFARLSKMTEPLPLRDAGSDAGSDGGGLREILQNVMAEVGIGRAVALRVAPPDAPVFSFGFLRPCIAVPENFAARHTPEEQYAILLHECIHIKQHDARTLLGMALANAVFWFDPVFRHALRGMKADMELRCDWAAVNTHGIAPAFYARLIVDALSAQQRFGPAFSDTYRIVARRLSHILRDRELQPPPRLSRRVAAGVLAGLAAGILAAAVFYAGLEPIPAADPRTLHIEGEPVVVEYEVRHGVFIVSAFARTARDQK
jgi:beta-lactamase regulating signal transducer with metallopeptidase domain